MNNYKSFSELKEELGNNYDFKLYEMGISALKEIENLEQENKQLRDNIRQMDNSIDKLQKQLIKEKDNWNKLKEDLINDINDRNGTKIAEFEDGNRVSETISPIYTLMEDKSKTMKEVLDKMQEIEKERNSNVKD